MASSGSATCPRCEAPLSAGARCPFCGALAVANTPDARQDADRAPPPPRDAGASAAVDPRGPRESFPSLPGWAPSPLPPMPDLPRSPALPRAPAATPPYATPLAPATAAADPLAPAHVSPFDPEPAHANPFAPSSPHANPFASAAPLAPAVLHATASPFAPAIAPPTSFGPTNTLSPPLPPSASFSPVVPFAASRRRAAVLAPDRAPPAASRQPRGPLGAALLSDRRALALVTGGALLVALAAFAFARRGPAPPPSPPRAVEPLSAAPGVAIPAPLADPHRLDPSDLYPRIKRQALAWNRSARLVSISASPVLGDKVEIERDGAEIAYVFSADREAEPDRGQAAPPLPDGPRMGSIAIAVTREEIRRTVTPNVAVEVPEPNCVFDAAAKAARASAAVPAGTVLGLRYERDRALGRAVWTARVEGRPELDRSMDGQTCAIVARR